MSDAHVRAVNGPTDMEPDQLAERKRAAAVDYYKAEIAALKDSLKKLSAKKSPDKDKVANQKQMIADAEAALSEAKGN